MGLVARSYTAGDLPQCVEIFKSNVPVWFKINELDEYCEFICCSGCPYFVLSHDCEVVACGGYGIRPGESVASLCWGMVHRQWHGKRVGLHLLLLRLALIAEQAELTGVRLSTSQLTSGFFEKYGFSIQSVQPNAIAVGLDAVEMSLELNPGLRREFIAKWNSIAAQG